MFKNKYLRFLIGVVLAALGGCAAVDSGWRGELSGAPPAVQASARACAAHFAALDAWVARTGVGDAEAHRLQGFPYLRVDRFHAGLRAAARADAQARAQWLARLQALDQAARRAEIANLPDAAVRALQPENPDRAALLETTARCAGVLREQDAPVPARVDAIHARAQVPDAYATWLRVAGFYSLTQWPFARGIAQWHDEARRDFQRGATVGAYDVSTTRYVPAAKSAVRRAEIAALLRRAGDNPLRVPQFSDDEQKLLLDAYAPVLEVESGGDYDRIGTLRLNSDSGPAVVDGASVLYHRIAYTRFGERILTQLIYTAWFPERPLDHALDVLGGHLDGVVLRVTLNDDGDPLLYDSIHPCGCYHMFFPTARVEPLPAPEDAGEWAFAPASLPAHGAGTRIVLRIATRTHYITQIALEAGGGGRQYALLPESGLRTLPLPDQPRRSRSLYRPDGLVAGTARGERFFFWPMGIPSAGAMRQWGNHATAFVGRRHFDDADLIEKRFRLIDR